VGLRCPCGEFVSDGSEWLAHRARFLSDQDYSDLIDALGARLHRLGSVLLEVPPDATAFAREMTERAAADVEEIVARYLRRSLYHCEACGRLTVEDASRRTHAFEPGPAPAPRRLLTSVEGDAWKRPLRGHWDRAVGRGTLWWGGAGSDQGFERFERFDALEKRYHDVFERLRKKNILRESTLVDGEETVHRWGARNG
jgi:hypothetical protein